MTPNEMFAEAKKQMLEGREPSTRKDWYLVMNFFASSIVPSCAHICCKLMVTMFDIPLSPEEVTQIVDFQLKRQQETHPAKTA